MKWTLNLCASTSIQAGLALGQMSLSFHLSKYAFDKRKHRKGLLLSTAGLKLTLMVAESSVTLVLVLLRDLLLCPPYSAHPVENAAGANIFQFSAN